MQYLIIFLADVIIVFTYVFLQPKRHEKINSQQPGTKEINYPYFSDDPFIATEAAGLDYSQINYN